MSFILVLKFDKNNLTPAEGREMLLRFPNAVKSWAALDEHADRVERFMDAMVKENEGE